jgi:hypothetical protein
MKWRDLKNLSPEERKEMRRAVAKTTSDQISYLKKIQEAKKLEEEIQGSIEEEEE